MRKLLLVTIALLLAACTRSASESPLPDATQDPLDSVFSTIATQTALAAQAHDPDLDPAESASPTGLFGATATLASSPTPQPTGTTTPAPISDQDVPANYTLHAGEWPYCLARRFDIDIDALLSANGLSADQSQSLSVGYKLVIPSDAPAYGGPRSLRDHPSTYVASGSDSFYSIACAFGDVYPENIAEANGMDVDQEIPGGRQLHIP
ncbi:MAG: LysM peptidoglycan-binding domain-containing protein [Anaerolineales bacterium]